jgi:hypothetical protein
MKVLKPGEMTRRLLRELLIQTEQTAAKEVHITIRDPLNITTGPAMSREQFRYCWKKVKAAHGPHLVAVAGAHN